MLVLALGASLALMALEAAVPGLAPVAALRDALEGIDFREAVLNGLLAFLLFAGALDVDLARLRERALAVGVLATLGVLASTGLFGAGFWALARLAGQPVPLAWCLVLGAVVSPTDPAAVLDMLKGAGAPPELESDMAGESLLNDGVGVVLFAVLLGLALGDDAGAGASPAAIAGHLAREVLGALGLLAGHLAHRMLRAVDDLGVETLVTLGLVTGAYALARHLGVSGPLAMVAAGLLVGDRAPRDAMSPRSQRHVLGFWRVVDQVLNAVLFLLIGVEVLVVRLGGAHAGLALAAVRLALSLPPSPRRAALLTAAHAVVVFAVVVQGATFARALRADGGAPAVPDPGPATTGAASDR